MITFTSPYVGSNEKDFKQVRGIALKRREAVLVMDTHRRHIGVFDLLGNFHEPSVMPLTATLKDRLIYNVEHWPSTSKRDRHSKVATIGLLMRAEAVG